MQIEPAAQTFPHAPQELGLESVLVSQPLVRLPSQSAKPTLQLVLHAPAEQTAEALGALAHAVPQAPQLAGELRSTSHPFAATWSQSANPDAQAEVQKPAAHDATLFGNTGHAFPH